MPQVPQYRQQVRPYVPGPYQPRETMLESVVGAIGKGLDLLDEYARRHAGEKAAQASASADLELRALEEEVRQLPPEERVAAFRDGSKEIFAGYQSGLKDLHSRTMFGQYYAGRQTSTNDRVYAQMINDGRATSKQRTDTKTQQLVAGLSVGEDGSSNFWDSVNQLQAAYSFEQGAGWYNDEELKARYAADRELIENEALAQEILAGALKGGDPDATMAAPPTPSLVERVGAERATKILGMARSYLATKRDQEKLVTEAYRDRAYETGLRRIYGSARFDAQNQLIPESVHRLTMEELQTAPEYKYLSKEEREHLFLASERWWDSLLGKGGDEGENPLSVVQFYNMLYDPHKSRAQVKAFLAQEVVAGRMSAGKMGGYVEKVDSKRPDPLTVARDEGYDLAKNGLRSWMDKNFFQNPDRMKSEEWNRRLGIATDALMILAQEYNDSNSGLMDPLHLSTYMEGLYKDVEASMAQGTRIGILRGRAPAAKDLQRTAGRPGAYLYTLSQAQDDPDPGLSGFAREFENEILRSGGQFGKIPYKVYDSEDPNKEVFSTDHYFIKGPNGADRFFHREYLPDKKRYTYRELSVEQWERETLPDYYVQQRALVAFKENGPLKGLGEWNLSTRISTPQYDANGKLVKQGEMFTLVYTPNPRTEADGTPIPALVYIHTGKDGKGRDTWAVHLRDPEQNPDKLIQEAEVRQERSELNVRLSDYLEGEFEKHLANNSESGQTNWAVWRGMKNTLKLTDEQLKAKIEARGVTVQGFPAQPAAPATAPERPSRRATGSRYAPGERER